MKCSVRMNNILLCSWHLGTRPFEWLYHARHPDSELEIAIEDWREAVVACQIPEGIMPEALPESVDDESVLIEYRKILGVSRLIRRQIEKQHSWEATIIFDIGAKLGDALIKTATQGTIFDLAVRDVRSAIHMLEEATFISASHIQKELMILLETMSKTDDVLRKTNFPDDMRAQARANVISAILQINGLVANELYINASKINGEMSNALVETQGIPATYDVFLSYSNLDKDLAEELYSVIPYAGLNVFMDCKDLSAGSVWNAELRNAIRRSKRMLLVITPKSKNRPWLLYETDAAWALGLQVIPVLSHIEPSELDAMISQFQARSIVTSKQREEFVRELCGAQT